MIDISKYPILNKFKLAKNDFIILYSSSPGLGVRYEEIYGREIFRIKNDQIYWQISIPNIPENELFWRDDISEFLATDRFNSINQEISYAGVTQTKDEILVTTMAGYIFLVNIETGIAKYKRWTKM